MQTENRTATQLLSEQRDCTLWFGEPNSKSVYDALKIE